MYYGGFTYTEYYNLSVEYKRWFIQRIVQEINRSNKQGDGGQSRGLHDNTPAMRQIKNMARDHVPSRMRRFT